MNISSFTMLNSALSGVEAAQQELETTSQNISNDDTPGYEEQTVDLDQSPSLSIYTNGSNYQLGEGVTVKTVSNTDDPYLNAEWRSQNAASSGASTTYSYLEQADGLVGDPAQDTGISNQLSTFWKDWNELAENPDSTATNSAQDAVVESGQQVATALNELSDQIAGPDSDSVLSQVNSKYDDLLAAPTGTNTTGGEVYQYASQIATLNQEIVAQGGSGANANALLDQRNEDLDDLSALGNTTVTDNSDGSVTVAFGGVSASGSSGVALVSGSTNNFTNWSSAYQSELSSASSASSAATSVGGDLGSLIGLAGLNGGTLATASTIGDSSTLSGTLGSILSSLNTVASDLASSVNGVYSSNGYSSSSYFFTTSDGSSTFTAANIAVNSTYTSDPTQLSAGKSGGASGDATLATGIAELANGSSGSANSAYDGFVELVGNLTSGAETTAQTESELSTSVTNQRDSVEGVDLDQEMEKLIAEQQAYQASAKVMNAFSTVMDALMQVVGA